MTPHPKPLGEATPAAPPPPKPFGVFFAQYNVGTLNTIFPFSSLAPQVTSNRPTVLFNEQPKGPHPVPVLDGHGFGTNIGFIGKGDGQGTSVKARTTELLQPTRFAAGYRPARHTKPAGPLGTNQAFVGKFDGAGQSTKARATMLDQEYNNYGQKARAFYQKVGLMSKAEAKWASSLQTGGEKAPVQMLAQHNRVEPPTPTVWSQIGTQNPSPKAQRVMKENDNFGYKAPVQMLAQKQQPSNVWQQIGAPEPAQAAQGAMKNSDNFGYKAPVQMLAQKQQPSNVWQQIGAPEPAQAAQGAMKNSDNFGYKAPVQMLSEKHHPTPNVWRQIGAPQPAQAAQQAMGNSDNFGYKASPQVSHPPYCLFFPLLEVLEETSLKLARRLLWFGSYSELDSKTRILHRCSSLTRDHCRTCAPSVADRAQHPRETP